MPLNPSATSVLGCVKSKFSLFRELSKSGIVALVLISVLGGYLIGQPSETPLEWIRLVLTLVGILCLAAGSSALNQFQEQATDAEMPRTAKRPLPSGRISNSGVLLFVFCGVLIGLAILFFLGRELFALGLLAVIFYNGLYTLWWKRHWAYAAVPGAIPGALPILMGYGAASGRCFAPGGLYLFFVLFFWQMPHFWVLALRFRKDYAAGGFPTLPVAKGEGVTVFQIGLWGLAYVALALLAPLFLPVSSIYLAIALATSGKVLFELWHFSKDPADKNWLRFFLWVNFSLILYIGGAALDMWSFYITTFRI